MILVVFVCSMELAQTSTYDSDANGSYVSEEGPADTSIGTKERLFGMTLMKMEA